VKKANPLKGEGAKPQIYGYYQDGWVATEMRKQQVKCSSGSSTEGHILYLWERVKDANGS